MQKVLEIINLTKVYRNKRGIHNINLSIEKGDIYGFLGPNGAGKTTTMKILAGLMQKNSGEIMVLGKNFPENFEESMSHMGFVIEGAKIYPYMSGNENLMLVKRYYPEIYEDRINEVLYQVGLLKYKHEKAGTYSHGMKQKLALAMAMISKPQLLILDEPANGLDIESQADIREVIIHLAKEEKTTFLISSHNIHEIENICNKAAIINEGSIRQVVSINEFKEKGESLEKYYIELIRGKAI